MRAGTRRRQRIVGKAASIAVNGGNTVDDVVQVADQDGGSRQDYVGRLGLTPLIHPTATIRDCRIGPWTAIGARTVLTNTVLGAYSYVVEDAEIANAEIGRFCSIAAKTRLNPGNHPTWRASQHHFVYRASAYELGPDEPELFAWRRGHHVTLGHDVWIGHGAIVLPGRSVATGAVVGAGAGGGARRAALCRGGGQSRPARAPPLSRARDRPTVGSRLVGMAARAASGAASRLSYPADRGLSRQVWPLTCAAG